MTRLRHPTDPAAFLRPEEVEVQKSIAQVERRFVRTGPTVSDMFELGRELTTLKRALRRAHGGRPPRAVDLFVGRLPGFTRDRGYRAVRFFKRLTANDAARLTKAGVSVEIASRLLPRSLTDADRSRLVEKWVADPPSYRTADNEYVAVAGERRQRRAARPRAAGPDLSPRVCCWKLLLEARRMHTRLTAATGILSVVPRDALGRREASETAAVLVSLVSQSGTLIRQLKTLS